MRCTGRVSVWTAAVMGGVCTSSVLAQAEALPPDPETPYVQWVCVLLFSAFVIAVAFKNPKRSHKG